MKDFSIKNAKESLLVKTRLIALLCLYAYIDTRKMPSEQPGKATIISSLPALDPERVWHILSP
jgi:hypothetical protein